MKTVVSPEGIKVLGGLLAHACDVGLARRVASEVHAALCEIDGIAAVGDSLLAVVVDALGDVDWQSTATESGWVSEQKHRESVTGLQDQTESWRQKYDIMFADRVTARRERDEALALVSDLRVQIKALDRECNELRGLAAVATAPKTSPAMAPAAPVAGVAAVDEPACPASMNEATWARLTLAQKLAIAARGGVK